MAGFYARKIFRAGEEIEMDGRRGMLIGITPLQALVQEGDRSVTIPNAVFLDQAVRQ